MSTDSSVSHSKEHRKSRDRASSELTPKQSENSDFPRVASSKKRKGGSVRGLTKENAEDALREKEKLSKESKSSGKRCFISIIILFIITNFQ